MENQIEIWKDVIGFEGLYQVSSLGKVKNRKLLNIKPQINTHGYEYVSLYKNSLKKHYSIHRLIALHFIPNPENKKCVNHIDGNKLNNSLNNLEWCTSSENNIHALENNLRKPRKGEYSTQTKLNEEGVIFIRKTKGIFTNQEMADKYDVSRSVIAQIRLYNSWKHVK